MILFVFQILKRHKENNRHTIIIGVQNETVMKKRSQCSTRPSQQHNLFKMYSFKTSYNTWIKTVLKKNNKKVWNKNGMIKKWTSRDFFCICLYCAFFFISWDSSVNLPFCLIDNKKEKFPQNEIERLHQCSQSFTQVWFPNSLAFFFK